MGPKSRATVVRFIACLPVVLGGRWHPFSSRQRSLNVFGEPLQPCGERPGSGSGNFCIARWYDAGAHQVCLPALPAEFSTLTGQGPWSRSYEGRPWCICVWAFLAHRDLEQQEEAVPLLPNCSAIPQEAIQVAQVLRHGAEVLCRTCEAQASSEAALQGLQRRCASPEKIKVYPSFVRDDTSLTQFLMTRFSYSISRVMVPLVILLLFQPGFWSACPAFLAACLGFSSVVVANGSAEGPCRICHGHGGCVSVCGCKGSVAAIHLQCLEAWRAAKPTASSRCEVCNQAYGTRSVWQAPWRHWQRPNGVP